MDWSDMTPDEARKKMIAAMRLDAEEEGEEEERPKEASKGGHGNTRLPYGLCKRFGIDLSDDATPRDAWAALEKGTGYTHDEVMEIVKKAGDTEEVREKKSGEKKAMPRCEGGTRGEVEKYYSDTLGLKTSFKNTVNPEVAKALANCVADAYDYAPKVKGSIAQCGSYTKMREELRKEEYPIWKKVYDRERWYVSDQQRRKWAWRDSLVRNNQDTEASYLEYPNVAKCFTKEDWDATEEVSKKYRGIYLHNEVDGASVEAIEKQRKADEATGWNPKGCGTVKSLFDHEVAHALDHAYKLSDNADVRKCIHKYGREKVSSDLSRYAGSHSSEQRFIEETIAEAWAEYKNNPEPRPIAEELGGIVEGIIKADGGEQ